MCCQVWGARQRCGSADGAAFTLWSLLCSPLGSSGTVPCRGLGDAHLCEVSVPRMEDCGPEPSIEGHLRKDRPVSVLPEVEETDGALLGFLFPERAMNKPRSHSYLAQSPQKDFPPL